MQQPPQLILMIKYKSSLLSNFSRQKGKRLSHWGWKDEKLLGLEDLQEITVPISVKGVLVASLKVTVEQPVDGKPSMFLQRRGHSSCKGSEKILLFLSAMHEMEHKPL